MRISTPYKPSTIRRFQWISVALLMPVGIVNILDRSTLAMANQDISSDLHLSGKEMGLLLSAFGWAYALSQLPIGVMLDRIGARIVLGAGLFVWSTAQLLGGFVTSLSQFLAARIFLGIGEGPTFPAGAKLIADWFNRRERGKPTGIFLSSPVISPIIGPPIITRLMIAFGWRKMFIILGAAGIGLSVIWYLIARDRKNVVLTAEENAYFDDSNEPATVQRKLSFAEWLGLFAQRSTWGIVLGFVGVIYMIWLHLTWLPRYLESEHHLSVAQAGWVVSIPYVFGTLGALFCGYVADYLLGRGISPINSRKWPICIGLLGCGAFTLPVIYAHDTCTAVIFLCVVMFFLYLASAGAWALINVATPTHMVATVGGLQNCGGYSIGAFASYITGSLYDRTHSFASALAVSSVIAFAAALVYFFLVREPIRETPNNSD